MYLQPNLILNSAVFLLKGTRNKV